MTTAESLAAAFAGESQANRKYLAFAAQAEAEGLHQIARLFRAAAEAETVHALAHLAAMGGIKSTAENLQEAIDGEGFEFQQMYPAYVEQALSDGHDEAVTSFRNAMAVEEIHHGLYGEALSAAQVGSDLPSRPIFVCSVCGNTVYDGAPEKCPICGSPRTKFHEIQ